MIRVSLVCSIVLGVVLGLSPVSLAQSPSPQTSETASAAAALLREAENRNPAQRLGLRAAVFRGTQRVVPTVVITPSDVLAMEVLANWQGRLKFPVLIDDGSPAAAENIGRFVRAFNPETVVRWSSDVPEMPRDRVERRRRLLTAWNRGVGVADPTPDAKPAVDRLRELGLGINGAVVVDTTDDAWISGLALAIGRLQVLVFAESSGRVGTMGSAASAEQLHSAITAQLDGLGLKWDELGDEVDALTIAMNMFTKVDDSGYRGDDTQTSITDRLPRRSPPTGDRWAWAGMMHGSAAESLYRAMCGLFLPTEDGWLFDGYGGGQPWELFDLTTAARNLQAVGMTTVLHDLPANNGDAWRRAVARGIRSDFVLINSKGLVGRFDLVGDQVFSGEAPVLHRPAFGVMVHSWSASRPDRTSSVAGRWFAQGAYGWYGSVQEPLLAAFVPSPTVAQRIAGGFPFAAAVSHANAPAWKLLYLGDPLVVAGLSANVGERLPDPLTITGSTLVEDEMRTAAGERRFADAIRALVVLGRDGDASRLARGVLQSRPESFGSSEAEVSVLALFRDGQYKAVFDAFAKLDRDARRRNVTLGDALWHSARALRPTDIDEEMIDLLAANLRRGQITYDALEIGKIIKVKAGSVEAGRYLTSLAGTLPDGRAEQTIRQYAGEYLEGKR